ncbi:MAG: restriction endonuclease subunit S [Thaumarchaeota archaeon]|nr:restriction endonuclease subunit S [Nitrososphaerota archaeon]
MPLLKILDNVPLKKISEVAQIVETGVRRFNGLKKYVKTGDMRDNTIVADREVTFENRPSRANMEVQEGDVLCARMKGTEKVLVITKQERNYLFSTGFAVLRAKRNLMTPRFLAYYLRFPYFQAEKDKAAHGATQKAINNPALYSISVPVPPLAIQERIVITLERADHLRRIREQANQLPDRIVQSLFLKIFGNPLENPLEWKTETIEKLCEEIYRYPTFYGLEYKPQGVPVIRIGNIQDDGTLDEDVSHYVFIDQKASEKFPRTILEFNDVIMAVRGDGSTGKIGHVSTRELVGANMSPNLIRIKTNPTKIHPLYLFHLLSSADGQELIKTRITRTAKKKLTAVELKAMEIPVPPIELQQKFATQAEKFNHLKRIQAVFLHDTNELFNSLMSKAFKGELVRNITETEETQHTVAKSSTLTDYMAP